KPNLVAPGVALATAEPGADATGAPRFGTVNGSSASAAIVAAAAALVAQARPPLDAGALAALLAESARPVAGQPAAAQGAGVVEPIGAQPLRVPWAITFGRPRRDLLGDVVLEPRAFAPSDFRPALLTVVAGRVVRSHARDEIQPLDRLDITLWNQKGAKLGLL